MVESDNSTKKAFTYKLILRHLLLSFPSWRLWLAPTLFHLLRNRYWMIQSLPFRSWGKWGSTFFTSLTTSLVIKSFRSFWMVLRAVQCAFLMSSLTSASLSLITRSIVYWSVIKLCLPCSAEPSMSVSACKIAFGDFDFGSRNDSGKGGATSDDGGGGLGCATYTWQ